jgi:hypothetical protein
VTLAECIEHWDNEIKSYGSFDDLRQVMVATLSHLRASAAKAGEGWQPIETAPRDSRRIIVGYYNYEGVWRAHEAWWRMPYESAPRKDCWWCHDGNSTLLSADVHTSPEGKKLGATHWQPLPAPPSHDCAPSPEQQGAEQRDDKANNQTKVTP